jgi:ubiquinone/menaquinone biosynthesis C-methylase UbiE
MSDQHGKNYKNIKSGAQMREYQRIADRVAADFPGGKILDWGCGWGQVSDLLLAWGLDVTSFDYDESGDDVRPLDHFPHVSVRYSQEPVKLPYQTGEFDAALSCGVLEHVHDPAGSLAELARVMKPGGLLYVYKLANRRSYLEWIAKRMGMYYHGQYPNDRLYTLPEARTLMTSSGYRVLEIRRANMLPLTALSGTAGQRLGGAIWAANRFLARIPGLNQFATNVELVAVPAS